MTRLPYKQRPPEQQALEDFKNGEGLAANPHNPSTEHELHDRYRWAMHKLWAQDFKAEQEGRP